MAQKKTSTSKKIRSATARKRGSGQASVSGARKTLKKLQKKVRSNKKAKRVVKSAVAKPRELSSLLFSKEQVQEFVDQLRSTEPKSRIISGKLVHINPHEETDPSHNVVEARKPDSVPESETSSEVKLRRNIAHQFTEWNRSLVASPRLYDAERRLNPHTREAARPEKFAQRTQEHASIPRAFVRGVSEAAERALEGVESAAKLPSFTRDRSQPIVPVQPRSMSSGFLLKGHPGFSDVYVSGYQQSEQDYSQEQPSASPDAEFTSNKWFPFQMVPNVARTGAAILLLAAIALLPLKFFDGYSAIVRLVEKVQTHGTQGVYAMRTAGTAVEQNDINTAASALAAASAAFGDARDALGPLGGSLLDLASKFPSATRAQTGAILFSAGETLSQAGEQFATRLAELPGDASPTDVVRAMRDIAVVVLPAVEKTADDLSRLRLQDVPEQYRTEVAALTDAVDAVNRGLEDVPQLAEAILAFLGDGAQRRYLLVFQNQNELRPTGGFIGSFAEVVVEDGEIVDFILPPGGSYDIQGDVRAWINPPQPLRLITGRWRFHDANWFPDFPTSARKLSWFYEKSGGPTVDGVIAVNATTLADLLSVTGPIDMPEYGVTLTSDNVITEIQNAIEINPIDPTKPKLILSELFPILLNKLRSPEPEDTLELADMLGKHLREKHIQLYSTDDQVQNVFATYGWDGSMKKTEGDYASLIISNIGGEKTDAVMQDEIKHTVTVQSDGRIVDTVTITRTHNGVKGAKLTGARNISHLRLYVPHGSTLLSASGDFSPPPPNQFSPRDSSFEDDPDVRSAVLVASDPGSKTEIYTEFDKTMFANWTQIDPGKSATVQFVYELPFRINIEEEDRGTLERFLPEFIKSKRQTYTLLLQKQSGAENRRISVDIHVPDTKQVLHVLPSWIEQTQTGVTLPPWQQSTDRFIGVIFGE